MSYRNRGRTSPSFSPATVHVDENGVTIHHQYESRGYGWQHYHFVGSLEGITAAVEAVKRRYPTAGYGTSFNWPPGRTYTWPEASKGKLVEYEQPVELEPGLWHLWGSHSSSCD
jgi:hypothetical protein